MIILSDKIKCCGCSSCVQKCPQKCITLREDKEGFLYPIINKDNCLDCGLCEKVCPIINQDESRKPFQVYAAKNLNEEIRQQSSSGGIFTLIAEKVIKEGGVVFGARFDESWEVKHDYTETIEGLTNFRGSKYVQSRIEDNYQKAETFLKQDRKVLFSGTPCQIAGFKHYLRKDYKNLLTIDFICHGVPSPGIWRKYLKETIARICDKSSVTSDSISKGNARIENISFRDKSCGWKKYCFVLTLSTTSRRGVKNKVSFREPFSQNTFMKGFLADLYLRPSCYACAAKCGKSGSDLTIADLWGAPSIIGKEDDDRGTSLIITYKEIPIMEKELSYWKKTIDYNKVLNYNPAIEHSAKTPSKRTMFYSCIEKTEELEIVINRLTQKNVWDIILSTIKRIIKKFLSFK